MKTRMILMIAMSIAVVSAVLAAPAPLQVTLSLPITRTLPGASVPLVIHVQNGAGALHLGPSLRVRATSPDGRTFFARWGGSEDLGELELGIVDDDTDGSLTLPANSAVDLGVPALDFSRPSWALDGRILALPGDWKLQVLLYEDDATQPVATSNSVKLTIDTPSGSDVEVWQAIQRGEFWSISEKVLSEHPDSQYAPYLATTVRRAATPDKIAIIKNAIESHPASPVLPSLHYALASYYAMEADRVFFKERDLEKASSLAEDGRAELALMKNGNDPWAKLKANVKLMDYPSRDYFLDLQRLQREKGGRKQ